MLYGYVHDFPWCPSISGSSIKREVSPKFELGEKRYGRLSLPVSAEDLDGLTVVDDDDIEVASSTRSLKHSLVVEDASDSEEVGTAISTH